LFCLSARNFHAAVYTRTEFLGPYLNLNDLLLWIAFFAMVTELFKKGKALWMPKILLAIFALLLIGDLQSLFKYGFIEECCEGFGAPQLSHSFFSRGKPCQ
jgi:hypothetical protein